MGAIGIEPAEEATSVGKEKAGIASGLAGGKESGTERDQCGPSGKAGKNRCKERAGEVHDFLAPPVTLPSLAPNRPRLAKMLPSVAGSIKGRLTPRACKTPQTAVAAPMEVVKGERHREPS